MQLESTGVSHMGRRSNNEDALLVAPELGLFAVCDGVGGYEGGEIASRLAVETLQAFFRRERQEGDATWPFGLDRTRSVEENRLAVALQLAHTEIACRRHGQLAMMGSTAAALAIDGDQAVIGHVGDSRVYRLRDGRLAQLTRDHSLYAELQEAGARELPAKEACGFANVITRALGMESPLRPDTRTERLVHGDLYLLCTDGLTEKLDDARIATLLAGADPCRALVEAAYAAGGRDNITAVVVRCQSSSRAGTIP